MTLNLILGVFGTQGIAIVLLIVIILVAIKSSTSETDVTISANQSNKVVNVSLTGGIIGMFSSSPRNVLNSRIQNENASGWKVIQVIPADSGNIFLTVFRLLLLICTLFLYTTSNGYYVILERQLSSEQIANGNASIKGQKCPNCGNEFSLDMKGGFCQECGTKL